MARKHDARVSELSVAKGGNVVIETEPEDTLLLNKRYYYENVSPPRVYDVAIQK